MKKPNKNSRIFASDHIAHVRNIVTFSRHFNGVKKEARFLPITCKKGLFSYIMPFIRFFRLLAANAQLFDFPGNQRKRAKQ